MENESFEQFREDVMKNGYRLIRIARDNKPLELIQGKPIVNFFRRILLTKYITTYGQWRFRGGYPINLDYNKKY